MKRVGPRRVALHELGGGILSIGYVSFIQVNTCTDREPEWGNLKDREKQADQGKWTREKKRTYFAKHDGEVIVTVGLQLIEPES